MEFDTETDPDTLYELFGEDADSLAECVRSTLLHKCSATSSNYF